MTISFCSSVNLGSLDSAYPWASLLASIFSRMTLGYSPLRRIGSANQPRANWMTLSAASEQDYVRIMSVRSVSSPPRCDGSEGSSGTAQCMLRVIPILPAWEEAYFWW